MIGPIRNLMMSIKKLLKRCQFRITSNQLTLKFPPFAQSKRDVRFYGKSGNMNGWIRVKVEHMRWPRSIGGLWGWEWALSSADARSWEDKRRVCTAQALGRSHFWPKARSKIGTRAPVQAPRSVNDARLAGSCPCPLRRALSM
jgi:hypothetical protein